MTVVGVVCSILPTWDETLDAVCLVVGPRRVGPSQPLPDEDAIVYGPTHQDPPFRQPITRSDELRVFVVEPGAGTEEVRCRMLNVAQSWRTRYDALSYTWGDESVGRETIVVDGLRTSVTKNLYLALVHLRDPARPRLLWVDALCINQDDDAERDEQVQKMGSIYSSARKVVVWLGEQTRDVEGAFAMIESGAAASTSSIRAHHFTAGGWSPVFNLLRRPWFQRTWIIQEAVLARDPVLVCGFESLPWKTLSKCCTSLEFDGIVPHHDPAVSHAVGAINIIEQARLETHTKYVYTSLRRSPSGKRYRTKSKYTPEFRLASTLYATRGFQCKDPRDKVFGVLSLVTDVGPDDETLRVNYAAGVEQVYQAVAQWEMTKNESLELLSYCSRKTGRHPDMPSWVPDFSDMEDAESVLYLREAESRSHYRRRWNNKKKEPERQCNPGFEEEGCRPSFYEENGKTVLVLTGKVVDSIAEVGAVTKRPNTAIHGGSLGGDGPPELDMTGVAKRRECLSEYVRTALAADPVPVPGRDEPGTGRVPYWRSPTLGMSEYQFEQFRRVLGYFGEHRVEKDHMQGYARFLHGSDGDPQLHQGWHWLGYLDRSFHKMAGRRFCATRAGKIGCVPGGAREGDLVCLISGARVPIILRRVQAGERLRYVVVGDAYISEMMRPGVYVHRFDGERLAII
jgi:hypothetical protein